MNWFYEVELGLKSTSYYNQSCFFEKIINILSLGDKDAFLRVSYFYPKEVLIFLDPSSHTQ